MGKRDYRWREKKKAKKDAKKDAKKISATTIVSPPITTVEVIKKVRKEPKVDEEQEK